MIPSSIWVDKRIDDRVDSQVGGRVVLFRLDDQGGQDEQLFEMRKKQGFLIRWPIWPSWPVEIAISSLLIGKTSQIGKT